MVEELKGKIRVFCRIRPVSKNEKTSEVAVQPSDPYTVSLETSKGFKEFQFDRVFTPEESQEQVFCDTQVRDLAQLFAFLEANHYQCVTILFIVIPCQ